MKRDVRTKWLRTVEMKLTIGFVLIIVVIVLCTTAVFNKAILLAKNTTYEKMNTQAEFYQQRLDNEIRHIRKLQQVFFTDRKLPFIVNDDIIVDGYEKREALLSVKERLSTVAGVSDLVEEAVLYLPDANHCITQSRVDLMQEKDEARMEHYLEYSNGQIHYDGKSCFMLESGMSHRKKSDKVPHLLVITLSPKRIYEDLKTLNTDQGSGSFFYLEEAESLIEHSTGEYVGGKILSELQSGDSGTYDAVQELVIDGEKYLVFVGGHGEIGLFVEYMRENTVMGPIHRIQRIIYLIYTLMLSAAVFWGFYSNRLLHRPMNVLIQAFQRLQAGDLSEHIVHNRKDEFGYLYESFNAMEDRMREMIDKVYVQTNLAQQAQMKQLQAQIAPHFLYNSYFSLSRKIKRGDYENAEQMAKHLGTYFEYLTRNAFDNVTIKQEVDHARSYATVQAVRFVYRIEVRFEELPPSFQQVQVPRLILQPLLENAFSYGLEDKSENGILWVHFQEDERTYRVLVEDNGDSSDEKLEKMKTILFEGKEGEVTGICNIHRRLQIFGKGRCGLRVFRSSLGGIGVAIEIGKGASGDEPNAVDC